MEISVVFHSQLSSLYEVKPPVSRAKMTHVTKCAIKAIKFYKHVVQSVEKFILKVGYCYLLLSNKNVIVVYYDCVFIMKCVYISHVKKLRVICRSNIFYLHT